MNLLLVLLLAGSADNPFGRAIRTSPDHTQYLAGQLILELSPQARGRVHLTQNQGCAGFGLTELDRLCADWQVSRIQPLMRAPRPSPAAMKHNCDLQYLIEFSQELDVAQVSRSFSTCPLVSYATVNALLPVIDEIPNDSLFGRQWHLPVIGAPFAWGTGHGDTTVMVAVADDGCEWFHPDIMPNVWVNVAEDINGNGRFDTLYAPDGDLDGVDQDGNGYTDDVIGFDMVLGVPDPKPYLLSDAHGTHCWGIANAATNNRTGIAGPPWNCRAPAYRCGGGGLIALSAAISAMYHAVGIGASVISLSFGGYSPYQPLNDACQYAWESGLVVCGGAGNDGTSNIFYPANYEHVISVAASDRNDLRPYWSNYGDWIEVTAPGVDIFSTIPGLSYGTMSGTSMATPLTAGVVAWIRSQFRGFTNAQVCSTLYAACEPMPDTMYPQGLLGHGRISMSMVVMPLYLCDLRMTDWRFREPSGNGRPDPGETVSLIVTYANAAGWRDATGVYADLACNSAGVSITRSRATFPDIPAGSSASCSADSFVITLGPDMPPQILTFRLTVHAAPDVRRPDTSFTVMCSEPRLLIVDDDAGADFEKYYKAACDSNGVLFHTYTVQTAGSPSAETLSHYPVVFWFTGNEATNTLTTTDVASLTAFLNSGRNLMLSGQNIAQELAGESFLAEYLHAELLEDSVGKPYMVGLTADPITQGETIVLAGAGGANNARHCDGLRPLGSALGSAFFKDYADTTTYGLIRFSGSYRLVFFAVPFEAIDHATSRYLQKWTLVRRILEYFGERVPGIEQPDRILPTAGRLQLRVSPNPARAGRARLTLSGPLGKLNAPVTFSITDASGRVVQRSALIAQHSAVVLDLSNLRPGVHLVRVTDRSEHASAKLVVAD
jgi:subtilisin family serine protease